jgi:BON domain
MAALDYKYNEEIKMKKNSISALFLVILLIGISLAFAGTNQAGSEGNSINKKVNITFPAEKDKRHDPTIGRNSITDSEIRKQIEAKLNAENVPTKKITIEVTNGNVILRGNATNKDEETQIINIALSANGVKEVHSMLIVKSSR